jgi:large subunit ribosomal protein L12
MESIYAALILHKASKSITEAAIEKILKAAGIEPDSSQITKIVSGLKEKNIDQIISSAAAVPVMAAAAPAAESKGKEDRKEDKKKKKEEEEKKEAEPTGIGSLF